MFRGCGTALVTPFRRDLSLDEEALRRLVRRQIDAGIHFLVPCGSTGENPTLSRAEHLRGFEIPVEKGKAKGPVGPAPAASNTPPAPPPPREVEAPAPHALLPAPPPTTN